MKTHIFENPDQYSKNNALQYNFALAFLSKVSFNNHTRVLDLGCGDGVITNEIAKIVQISCVIGTDISSQMISHASNIYKNQDNLRFIQMDASKNIFYNQFDIITSFNCLHWIQDQKKVLQGIANAAAEGAQIALLFSHKKSLYHLVLDKICSQKKWSHYFEDFSSPRYFFTKETYESMMTEEGLEVSSILEEEMTYHFKSKEQLKEFFSAAGSQIKSIPEVYKDAFLEDFAKEFLRQVECKDDTLIPLSFWCLQIVASAPVKSLDISQSINSTLNSY